MSNMDDWQAHYLAAEELLVRADKALSWGTDGWKIAGSLASMAQAHAILATAKVGF